MIDFLLSFYCLLSPFLFFFFYCASRLGQNPLRTRWLFEQKNLSDPRARSWKSEHKKARFAFEISSEGELELVAPLLTHFLRQGVLLELIYCSPSVEKKAQALASTYPSLRLLRLPLLTYFPGGGPLWGQSVGSWMTAPILVLCRYDFFPELLWLGRHRCRAFYLVSASLKSKEKSLSSFFRRFLYRELYGRFDQIFCTNEKQRELFAQKLALPASKLAVAELRPGQIAQRLQKKSQHPFFSGALYQEMVRAWQPFSRQERLILGSFWSYEAALFSDPAFQSAIKGQKLFVLVVCHQGGTGLTEAKQKVRAVVGESIPLYDWQEGGQVQQGMGIYFLSVKGILCELYQDFGHAYVGGGFSEKGVHSLLEPFLAGAQVYMGPQVARSTEFDWIEAQAAGSLHVCPRLEDFYQILVQYQGEQMDHALLTQAILQEEKNAQGLVLLMEKEIT